MTSANAVFLFCLTAACCLFFTVPAQAFTANSLDISVAENGDAIATFRFTLEGIIENSIPQSVLEEELKKGLTTSSDPPELKSMDRSGAVLLMKKFADTADVPTGTEYRTATMDFRKAEVALQNSALSSVVSADFSPEKIVVTFPDSYRREFTNADVLPALTHVVIDPSRAARLTVSPAITVQRAASGFLNITSSPAGVRVYLDGSYIGEAPALFPEISAGTHMAEFRKDGYESVSKSIIVLEGKTTGIMVILRSVPAEKTVETGAAVWSVWPFVVLAVIALGGGGYYFWSRQKKKEVCGEDDEDAEDGDS